MNEREVSRQLLEIIPRAMRIIRNEMRKYAKGQLTVPQFRILIRLNRFQKQTHKEVAEWLGVTPATLTRIVDTLVKRKLVTRQTSTRDRRQTLLSPTATGKALAQKYLDHINSQIRDSIDALSHKEQEKLLEGVQIMAKIFPDLEHTEI